MHGATAAGALWSRLSLAAVVGAFALMVALVATRSPTLTLAAVLVGAMAAIAFRSLPLAVALFLVLTFFEALPGTGQSVTLVKVVSAILFVALIGALGRRSGHPVLVAAHPGVAYAAVALVGWALASRLWAADGGAATAGGFRLAEMVFLVFLVFSAIRRPRHLRWLAWAFIAGVTVTTLVGLVTTGSSAFAAGGGRFRGDFGNPNNLAAVALPTLALAGFLLALERRRLARFVLACSACVVLLTLFLSQSRGGIVGLVAMAGAAAAFAGPLRPKAFAAILLIAAAGIAWFALVAPSSARSRVTHFSAADSTGRVDLWSIGLEIAERHPLVGIGSDNFPVVAPRYITTDANVHRVDLILRRQSVPVHNTYLNAFVDYGIVGFVLLMAFLSGVLVVAVRAVRALARRGSRDAELLGRALVIGAAGMLTAYFFFSAQYEKQLWVILGALLSLSSLARAGGSEASRP